MHLVIFSPFHLFHPCTLSSFHLRALVFNLGRFRVCNVTLLHVPIFALTRDSLCPLRTRLTTKRKCCLEDVRNSRPTNYPSATPCAEIAVPPHKHRTCFLARLEANKGSKGLTRWQCDTNAVKVTSAKLRPTGTSIHRHTAT